jgi:hypothetical protein
MRVKTTVYQNTHAVLHDIFYNTFSQRTKHETHLSECCEVAVLSFVITGMTFLMIVLNHYHNFKPLFFILCLLLLEAARSYKTSVLPTPSGTCPKNLGGTLSEIWQPFSTPSGKNAVLKKITTVITRNIIHIGPINFISDMANHSLY